MRRVILFVTTLAVLLLAVWVYWRVSTEVLPATTAWSPPKIESGGKTMPIPGDESSRVGSGKGVGIELVMDLLDGEGVSERCGGARPRSPRRPSAPLAGRRARSPTTRGRAARTRSVSTSRYSTPRR